MHPYLRKVTGTALLLGVVLGSEGILSPVWAESPRRPDALQVIAQRKSVRHYTNKPVSRETLELLLKAGMAAPTAADKRPWAFVVLSEASQRQAVAGILPFGRMLAGAQAAIVVCGLPRKSLPGIESEFWIQDCSAASENILLAAEALGLGAVWIGVYPLPERVQTLQKILGLPKEVVPLNVISLGYPTGVEKPKDKFQPANIHWNRW